MARIRRKLLAWSASALTAIAFAIQLVAYGRDHINPPVTREPAWHCAGIVARSTRRHRRSRYPELLRVASGTGGRKGRVEEVLQREITPTTSRFVRGHARLSAAEMERLASGLARTMNVSDGGTK